MHLLVLLRSLLLHELSSLADALEDLLTVLVELELVDNDFRGVDTDGDGLAV